jgi:peptidoglycan/xylan/chitin deacetylase (PgdA/CDA1 family)
LCSRFQNGARSATIGSEFGSYLGNVGYEIVEGVDGAPDPCKDTHFEYGIRAGYWRVMDLLDRYNVKAYANCCARAIAFSPGQCGIKGRRRQAI